MPLPFSREAAWPISNSPSSRFPSKMPSLARPFPSRARSSSGVAPASSAFATSSMNLPFTRRVGESFFSKRRVSPSSRFRQCSLKASLAELSWVRAKRVPICTPSAPKAWTASMASPVAMPPAAIRGRPVAWRTAGMRQRVVVSSRPLCPPASKPSATMASTPACSAFWAKRDEDTTCTTVMPCSCNQPVHFLGLPAEVNTILTPSSATSCITSSIWGYISGRFTPKGFDVAAWVFRICSRNVSGCIEPAPSKPSPPALLTAAANRHPLHHTMPPWTMGCSIPNKEVILFFCISKL